MSQKDSKNKQNTCSTISDTHPRKQSSDLGLEKSVLASFFDHMAKIQERCEDIIEDVNPDNEHYYRSICVANIGQRKIFMSDKDMPESFMGDKCYWATLAFENTYEILKGNRYLENTISDKGLYYLMIGFLIGTHGSEVLSLDSREEIIKYSEIAKRIKEAGEKGRTNRYSKARELYIRALSIAKMKWMSGANLKHDKMRDWLMGEFEENGDLPFYDLNRNSLKKRLKEMLYEMERPDLISGTPTPGP